MSYNKVKLRFLSFLGLNGFAFKNTSLPLFSVGEASHLYSQAPKAHIPNSKDKDKPPNPQLLGE